MKRRIAAKIMSSAHYFEVWSNPETGKQCLVPYSQKHMHLYRKACQKLKAEYVFDDICQEIYATL